MNKRDAKRAACLVAAADLEGALDNGLEAIDNFGDRAKIEASLRELIAELYRRAGDR